MKFKKEVPSKQGYYWYVDTTYPIPKIGFIGPFSEFFNDRMMPIDKGLVYKFIRIGDFIPTPDVQDQEIEE